MADELTTDSITVAQAGQVISAFLSDIQKRRVVLLQLVRTADFASTVAPAAWGITLKRNGIRLNVGRVEVMVAIDDSVVLNCVGRVGDAPFIGPSFRASGYKSVPDPKCAFYGPIDEFARIAPELQGSHRQFIELVGTKRSGQPVSGSGLAPRARQPVIEFARRFLAEKQDKDAWTTSTTNAQDFVRALDRDVERSLQDSAEARRSRLLNAPKKPDVLQTISRAFQRNPDVIAEVLLRANGKCEQCKADAPFLKATNNLPYLEVHHKKFLSDDGDDTVENALALCPNCHRKMHHGYQEVNA